MVRGPEDQDNKERDGGGDEVEQTQQEMTALYEQEREAAILGTMTEEE